MIATQQTTDEGAGPVDDGIAVVPPAPSTLEETGLSDAQVIDLLIKTLFKRGALEGNELAESVRLPFVILDDLLVAMTQRKFVAVLGTAGHGRAGYRYDLTDEGRNRAAAAMTASRYIGPAPVPLYQFKEWVEKQSVKNSRVSQDLLAQAFSDLVLSDDVMAALGPAVNSGSSIFLHGAAGNGKTAIAERLGSLISSEIYIPNAIIVDGHIIVVYDPVYHHQVDDPNDQVGDQDGLVRDGGAVDRRFRRVKRPTVFVGGELTMDQLDLQLSKFSQIYRAPFQVKAAGGVLIVDDFGRQRMSPAELLNRWIVPLEMGFDNLTLDTGVKFSVPFDSILIFATNLNPRTLLDEAFLRRIQFKVEVRSPDRDGYEKILQLNCREAKIGYDVKAVDYLFESFYEPHRITPRGCHPRDILHHIRSISSYEGSEPSLDPALLHRAAHAYFLVMEEELQQGVSSISTKA